MAGAAVIAENHNLLEIPVEVPEPPPPARRQPKGRGAGAQGGAGRGHLKQQSSQAQLNIPEIARGLLDRGEQLGINRASFFNAVSEIRVRKFGYAENDRKLDILFMTEKHSGSGSICCELHALPIYSWIQRPIPTWRRTNT
jgi:hypothetical protein